MTGDAALRIDRHLIVNLGITNIKLVNHRCSSSRGNNFVQPDTEGVMAVEEQIEAPVRNKKGLTATHLSERIFGAPSV